MAVRVPTTVIEDKFESYVAADVSTLLSAVKRGLSSYDFSEGQAGTSPFHRMYGMRLVSVLGAKEFQARFFIFSVHDYFSKVEVRGFSRSRGDVRSVLESVHGQLGSRIWSFTFKENVLVKLPNSAVALLFLVLPSLLIGRIDYYSLGLSSFLLYSILPALTGNLAKETEKKWKPYATASAHEAGKREREERPLFGKGEKEEEKEDLFGKEYDSWTVAKEEWGEEAKPKKMKKEKKKKEEEDELAWGSTESDYKWEGVWD